MQKKVNECRFQTYNDLFAPEETPTVSKGRETVKDVLDTAGTVLAVAGSAVSLALAINQLKGS